MIFLRDIMAMPMFSDFRIISGYNGMNNMITAVGYYEWESRADIRKNFIKGELIVTTLSLLKDNEELAESRLKALIQHKVSAIFIKDIYYFEVSDSLKQFSNENSVPIVFFSDMYIDEILFQVKMSLLNANSKKIEMILKELFSNSIETKKEYKNYVKEINPFLEDTILFCAYISYHEEVDVLSPELLKEYQNWNYPELSKFTQKILHLDIEDFSIKYSFIPFQRGIFHICTASSEICSIIEDEKIAKKFSIQFLENFFRIKENYRIGISIQNKSWDGIARALQEALFANTSCMIDQQTVVLYSEIGLDQYLCPLRNNVWVKQYYQNLYQKIMKYNESADTLISTLKIYVRCGGDVAITAMLTYQHSNTIRYRISRIKQAWNIKDNVSLHSQATIFVRLHQIYTLLGFLE